MPSIARQPNKNSLCSEGCNISRANTLFICLLLALVVLDICPNDAFPKGRPDFKEIEIRTPFREILMENPEFMHEGGASCFSEAAGATVLIGIAKVAPENHQPQSILKARRAGEILARTAILELRDGIKISTVKGIEQGNTLSSFFQVTETQVEGKIRQLPVIGTWMSPDRRFLYVAVGEAMNMTESAANVISNMNHTNKGPEGRSSGNDLVDVEGEEPFISLLKLSPVLRRNGGVRGFIMQNNDRILISIGSAALKRSPAKASKIARLRAVRYLLGHKQEIQLSSVEYLSDREHMSLSKHGEKRILISQFLSIQKEQIAGVINALPIVATWKGPERKILYVAIGRTFR